MGRQRSVQFDRDDAAGAQEQLIGQDAEAGTDLDDRIIGANPGRAHHSLHDAPLEQKVLAKPFVRPDAQPGHQRGPLAARVRDAIRGGWCIGDGGWSQHTFGVEVAHGSNAIPEPSVTRPISQSGASAAANAATNSVTFFPATESKRGPEVSGSNMRES